MFAMERGLSHAKGRAASHAPGRQIPSSGEPLYRATVRRRLPVLVLPLLLAGACSDDPTPPTTSPVPFEGASWVAPDKEGNLVVQWKRVEGVAGYRVYSSLNPGRTLKNLVRELKAADVVDGNPIVLRPSSYGAKHHVIVRAIDARGVEDGNVVERVALASPDTTAPTFAGTKVVSAEPNAGVTITWESAVDEGSPPEAIAYDVFAGPAAERLKFLGRTKTGERTFTATALGAPATPFFFTVHARDVADNVSTDPTPVSAPLGPDSTAPTFSGCGDITDVAAKSATLSWAVAADDHAEESDLSYEIYLAEASKAQDFTKPFVKVEHDTKVVLEGLTPGKAYYLVCRARDATGNVDQNTTEKAFTTPNDGTPPTFDGLATAIVDGTLRTADLSWPAATDDQTPQGAIVYDVFESTTAGQYAFDAPPKATTPPGATSIKLTDLTPRQSLNWVVRARDAAKNRDANTKEQSGVTKTSFALNVQPILTRSCAVVGCHVSGLEPSGLNLVPGIAYGKLVGVMSAQKAGTPRVTPGATGTSYLYEKITATTPFRGAQMPAPQTGSVLTQIDKDIITTWILDGALNN